LGWAEWVKEWLSGCWRRDIPSPCTTALPQKAANLKGKGATVADTPAGAAAGAEAVITMLADDAAVEETVFGERGLLGALPQGAVHVSMSTISVALSRRPRLRTRGCVRLSVCCPD
jgi:3-hydroxyisobutyrate dehydrogenase-like beta-hydroxyacid dehydrogenase